MKLGACPGRDIRWVIHLVCIFLAKKLRRWFPEQPNLTNITFSRHLITYRGDNDNNILAWLVQIRRNFKWLCALESFRSTQRWITLHPTNAEVTLLTHGMRRRSTRSRSDVRVNTTVVWYARDRIFFVFLDSADWFDNKPHSISKSIWTALLPPSECTPISFMFKTYWGKSATEARISLPKGGRRFSSCVKYVHISWSWNLV